RALHQPQPERGRCRAFYFLEAKHGAMRCDAVRTEILRALRRVVDTGGRRGRVLPALQRAAGGDAAALRRRRMRRLVVLAGEEKPTPAGAFRRGDRKPPQSDAGTWQRPEAEIGLAAYRSRTMGLLRRYARMAVQQGRLPSLVGREFFRARVSHYRMRTFEDYVIFTFDVQRCLEQLAPVDRV